MPHFVQGYSTTTILVVCFATSVAVLVLGSFLLLQDLREVNKDVAVRFENTRRKVVLQQLPKDKFHVFLSHSQEFGADQVSALCSVWNL